MRQFVSKIWNSPFARNVGKLLSANIFAQVLGFLVYPILTRLYAPEDFGLLNLFINIGNILVLLATMEYQYAIMLAKEKKQAVAAAQLASLLAVVWTLLTLLALPFREQIVSVFHIETSSNLFWLLPIYVLFNAAWNILNLCLMRGKQFGAISRYKITNSVLLSAAKLGMGWGGMTSIGLIVSTCIASILSLFITLSVRLKRGWTYITRLDWSAIKEVARSYKKFPVFSLPRAFANSLGAALPALLLVPFFGLEKMGIWSMAITLSFAPISLIVNSVQQVLFQKVTESVHQHQPIRPMLLRFTWMTVAVVLPFFILLYWPLPWITGWLLGEEWTASGEYIRWMLPWLLMVCLNGPICFVADVFMAQGVGLIFECAIMLARLLGLLFGIWMQRFDYAIAGYVGASAIVLIAQEIWFYSLINKYERTR